MTGLDLRFSPLLVGTVGAGLVLVLALFVVGKVPVSYNLRNLTVRWITTALTALAFTLVVSLLTVMLGFVSGMYRLTETSGQPGNVIILSEGATDETFSNMRFSDTGDIENQPGILRENGRPLCSPETYLVINQPLRNPVPGRPGRRFIQVRGVDDPAIAGQVHGLSLLEGSNWFSDGGVREAADPTAPPLIEAVLGAGLARVLGSDRTPEEIAASKNPDRLDVGDAFPLRGRDWVVAGVLESSGSTFDSEVWAKRSVIGPMLGKETYSSFVVRTENGASAVKVRDFFNKDFTKAAVAAQVETDYFASLAETSKQFLYAILFVAAVMSIGGVFGVMNTMFAAIAQRTKDIGVLRLLGYTRTQILVSFLLESLVIALVGGLLGCAIGYLANGWTFSSIVGSGPGGGKFVVLKLLVDANVLSAGVLLTLLMGFLGGLIPAFSAVRLKPLEALR